MFGVFLCEFYVNLELCFDICLIVRDVLCRSGAFLKMLFLNLFYCVVCGSDFSDFRVCWTRETNSTKTKSEIYKQIKKKETRNELQ